MAPVSLNLLLEVKVMNYGLAIHDSATLDFVCLGALVHRLDPGIIPFRKAHDCRIHVSGGEFNVAANLSDCFGLHTSIVTAMVKYPIGDLVAERVRAMGVTPFYKMFQHNGVTGPNIASVYSDRAYGVRAPVPGSYQREFGGGWLRRRAPGRCSSRCTRRAWDLCSPR